MNNRLNILLLGGTAEAILTAHALASQYRVIYSLAGATKHPRVPQNVEVRVGGFGGAAGLAQYCAHADISLIVDCTHPFAQRMSRHAVEGDASAPVIRLERPRWKPVVGDRWTSVPHLGAATHRLRHHPGPIALALGAGGEPLAKLLGARAHLRRWSNDLMLDDPMAEADWLSATGATLLVCKNSGGTAFGKLVAARRMNLPVMIIERPKILGGEVFHDVSWLVRTIQHRY